VSAKKTIFFVLWIIIIFCFCSCKADYHYKRIVKKEPDYFKVDTTTKKEIIKLTPVNTAIDCNTITAEPIVVQLPTTVNQRVDTVTITLFKEIDGSINTTVDCPDVEVITKTVPEPYPVYVEPSLKEKLRFAAGGLFGCIAVILLFLALKKIAFH